MELDQYLNLRNKKYNEVCAEINAWYELSEEEQKNTPRPDWPSYDTMSSINWKYVNHKTCPLNIELLYWRKANHIHNWFVNNIQNGEDDCGDYVVTIENLRSLYNLLKTITSKIEIEKGSHEVIFKEDKESVMKYCEEVLPTCSGFFFGSTEYDFFYFTDIIHTIVSLEEIFVYIDANYISDDSEDYAIYYSSSW